MSINQYIRIIRRWLWLISLSTFLVTGIAFVIYGIQPPEYRAQVTIIVGGYIESPDPDPQDIRTGRDLVETYVYLVQSRDVLQNTIDTLDLDIDIIDLSEMIDTGVIALTSLLQIGVTHDDSIEARDIANELANQLITESPGNLTIAQQEQIDFLNGQISSLSDELQDYREQSDDIEIQLTDNDLSTLQRRNLSDQRNFLLELINQSSANIAQFSSTIANLQQRSNSVEIIEHADIPTEPEGLSILLLIAIASATGLLLSTATVFLYEYLTDKIEDTESASAAMQLPMLGVITQFGGRKDAYAERLIVNLPALSKTTQEYSTLRTNLIYTTSSNHVYAVSSASPREGKSVTAMNLAISSALAGQRVLLIDADLRRPRLHQAFGLENGKGLTTLLQTSPAHPDTKADDILKDLIRESNVEGLSILPSGYMPQNPAELLGFVAISQWVDYFKEHQLYDMVIFDTPPILAVPDAAILAANIKARVLLVIQANSTRRIEAKQAQQRFEQINIVIDGMILNQVARQGESYYGYRYDDYYSGTANTEEASS